MVTNKFGRLTFKNSARWIKAWNKVLTPGNILILGCFMSILINPEMSLGFATRINKPPLRIPNKAQVVNPKIWVSGNAHKNTNCSTLASLSPGSSQVSIWMTFARMFLWSSMAPLEIPVVPPVYCKKATSPRPIMGLEKVRSLPNFKASLNRIHGKSHGGTSFLILRATKLITSPLMPRSSPRLLTITFFRGTWSAICSYVWQKFSKITRTAAPLSLSWCSSSLGAYKELTLTTTKPARNVPSIDTKYSVTLGNIMATREPGSKPTVWR